MQESDVLLAIGSSLTRTHYGQPIPDGKVIIHNAESIEDINKEFSVDIGLPGDAKLTLEAMIEEVKAQLGESGRKGQTQVATDIAILKKTWMDEWSPLLTSDEEPINTYRVIGDMVKAMNLENSIVTPRCRCPARLNHAFLPRYSPRTATSAGARPPTSGSVYH